MSLESAPYPLTGLLLSLREFPRRILFEVLVLISFVLYFFLCWFNYFSLFLVFPLVPNSSSGDHPPALEMVKHLLVLNSSSEDHPPALETVNHPLMPNSSSEDHPLALEMVKHLALSLKVFPQRMLFEVQICSEVDLVPLPVILKENLMPNSLNQGLAEAPSQEMNSLNQTVVSPLLVVEQMMSKASMTCMLFTQKISIAHVSIALVAVPLHEHKPPLMSHALV